MTRGVEALLRRHDRGGEPHGTAGTPATAMSILCDRVFALQSKRGSSVHFSVVGRRIWSRPWAIPQNAPTTVRTYPASSYAEGNLERPSSRTSPLRRPCREASQSKLCQAIRMLEFAKLLREQEPGPDRILDRRRRRVLAQSHPRRRVTGVCALRQLHADSGRAASDGSTQGRLRPPDQPSQDQAWPEKTERHEETMDKMSPRRWQHCDLFHWGEPRRKLNEQNRKRYRRPGKADASPRAQ